MVIAVGTALVNLLHQVLVAGRAGERRFSVIAVLDVRKGNALRPPAPAPVTVPRDAPLVWRLDRKSTENKMLADDKIL